MLLMTITLVIYKNLETFYLKFMRVTYNNYNHLEKKRKTWRL